jgi:hypothetical protein
MIEREFEEYGWKEKVEELGRKIREMDRRAKPEEEEQGGGQARLSRGAVDGRKTFAQMYRPIED